jgi:16S rRNA (guanine966-N2)-methyltransferase
MRNKGPTQVRIIGGQWKRTPLRVIDAQGLRPTPDRVRETVFNWLGDKVVGAQCLDLFAGTGALGFEAASRGAASVAFVEANPAARAQLAAMKAKLQASQLEVVGTDALLALKVLQARGQRFDVVFLDPPFGQDWPQRLLPMLSALLQPAAWVYLESESAFGGSEPAPSWALGWQVLKSAKAGQVHYHWLQFNPSKELPCQP